MERKVVFLSLVIQRLGETAVILCFLLPGSPLPPHPHCALPVPVWEGEHGCNVWHVFTPFTDCHSPLMKPYT